MDRYDNPYEKPTPGRGADFSDSNIPLPPVSGMAVGSLVIGIISTVTGLFALIGGIIGACCCFGAPVVVAPLAILLGIGGGVLGYFAMQECKNTGKRGHGMALAGVITSAVGGVFGAIVVVIVVGIMAFAAANQP